MVASYARIIVQHLNVNRAFCKQKASLLGPLWCKRRGFTRRDDRLVAQNIALFPPTGIRSQGKSVSLLAHTSPLLCLRATENVYFPIQILFVIWPVRV